MPVNRLTVAVACYLSTNLSSSVIPEVNREIALENLEAIRKLIEKGYNQTAKDDEALSAARKRWEKVLAETEDVVPIAMAVGE